MCAIDAAGSCGSNPCLFVAIRDLCPKVSLIYHPDCIQSIWILCDSIDATRACGSNAGLFFGIGRLVVKIRILLHGAASRDWGSNAGCFIFLAPSSLNYGINTEGA
eukprot:scaffold331842_cov35-Attheya_sp.AAC.1